MYGRIPKLSIDVEFGITFPEERSTSHQNYADKLKSHLQWAYRVTKETNDKESAWYKRYYDRKFRCAKVEEGDLVLVRVKAFRADHKIADCWEQVPYEVVKQMGKSPVYEIKPIRGDSQDTRTLHRNMLFPLQSRREETNEIPDQLVVANMAMEAYFS